VRAGTRRGPVWTLGVVSSTGVVVRTYPGTTSDVDVSWDLQDSAGAAVPPGRYTLRLTGTSADGDTALPWSAPVLVRMPSIPKGSWMRPGQYADSGEPAP
jgi:hypothetical protein